MAVKHKIRTSKGDGMLREVALTPNKAIRCQCLECVGWSASEVKECTDHHCPLYPFRLGTNPSRKRGQKEPSKIRRNGAIIS